MAHRTGLATRTLVGEQFALVPFSEVHITDTYLGWLNDPKVNRFLEVRFAPQTKESALQYLLARRSAAESYFWAIFDQGTQKMIGTAGLMGFQRQHGRAETGLLIGDSEYWGSGAANEAMQLVIEFGFRALGLRKLTGGNYAPNHGMNFIFKRMGFTREATERRAWLSDAGYVDGYRWGLLIDEWELAHLQLQEES